MNCNIELKRYCVNIRATIDEMNDFAEKIPDVGFYIESFSAFDTYKGNNREEILFRCVIKTSAALNIKQLSRKIFSLGELSCIVGGQQI